MRDEEFERLYEEHAEPLFGFLAYRTGDPSLAEDLLADTFERALRARARFDRRRASRKTWLYSIALNCLRDNLRRRDAERRATSRAGEALANDELDPLERADQRDVVERALASLSPEERDAIALRFGADLSVPEVAKLLKVPLTTVEGRVYGGLEKMRARLGQSAIET